MTKAYQIYVVDTGEVIGVQTWDDIQAPVVAAGQAARLAMCAVLSRWRAR